MTSVSISSGFAGVSDFLSILWLLLPSQLAFQLHFFWYCPRLHNRILSICLSILSVPTLSLLGSLPSSWTISSYPLTFIILFLPSQWPFSAKFFPRGQHFWSWLCVTFCAAQLVFLRLLALHGILWAVWQILFGSTGVERFIFGFRWTIMFYFCAYRVNIVLSRPTSVVTYWFQGCRSSRGLRFGALVFAVAF